MSTESNNSLRVDAGQQDVVPAPKYRFRVLEDPSAVEQESSATRIDILQGLLQKRAQELLAAYDAEEIDDDELDMPIIGMTRRDLLHIVALNIRASEKDLLELENLRKIAYIDSLTKLSTRLVLMKELSDRLEALRSKRSADRSPFAVVMTDIDHFKKFNDTYGHNAGDEVLASVAQKFQDALRTDPKGKDIAARYGGEEFGFIIDGISSDEEMGKVMQRLQNIQFSFDGPDGKVPVTVSMGGFICTPENKTEDMTPVTLLQKADEHLYWVKADGRDGFSFSMLNGERRITQDGATE